MMMHLIYRTFWVLTLLLCCFSCGFVEELADMVEESDMQTTSELSPTITMEVVELSPTNAEVTAKIWDLGDHCINQENVSYGFLYFPDGAGAKPSVLKLGTVPSRLPFSYSADIGGLDPEETYMICTYVEQETNSATSDEVLLTPWERR